MTPSHMGKARKGRHHNIRAFDRVQCHGYIYIPQQQIFVYFQSPGEVSPRQISLCKVCTERRDNDQVHPLLTSQGIPSPHLSFLVKRKERRLRVSFPHKCGQGLTPRTRPRRISSARQGPEERRNRGTKREGETIRSEKPLRIFSSSHARPPNLRLDDCCRDCQLSLPANLPLHPPTKHSNPATVPSLNPIREQNGSTTGQGSPWEPRHPTRPWWWRHRRRPSCCCRSGRRHPTRHRWRQHQRNQQGRPPSHHRR